MIEFKTAPRCAECTKPFVRPPSAPHKRFCSSTCRDQFHSKERAEAVAEIRTRRATSQGHQT